MIVDFTVTNFLSIKDEQTFSLHVSVPGTHLPEHVCYPAQDKIGVLRAAGFYGANASGKSNVLLAFMALRFIIVNSGALKDGEDIFCYTPYRLSAASKTLPTRFEIEFLVPNAALGKALRYRYCVAFTRGKIVEESLFFYPSNQQALVFSRSAEDSWQTITFGSLYKGGKKRVPFFANNAYLSKAGNSADTPAMIRRVYNYFQADFLYLGIGTDFSDLSWAKQSFFAGILKKVTAFLSLVDTGIADISIEEKVVSASVTEYRPLFSHRTDTGGIEVFDKQSESTGTQRLFDLAPLILFSLLDGVTLIIDELEHSLHPFMAELVIKLFNDPRVNKHNAQLIFSTHNISLMSPELLRRDQIWFTEKHQGATTFYSLDDFDKKKIKPHSPYNQWYAEGRFGAVPTINYKGIVDLFNDGDADAETEN